MATTTTTRSGITRTLYFDTAKSCFMFIVKQGNIVTPIKLPRTVYCEKEAMKLGRLAEKELLAR